MFGIGKKIKADETNRMAEAIANAAQIKVSHARANLYKAMSEFGELKLDVYSNEINEFVQLFSSIKDIDYNENISVEGFANIKISEYEIGEMKADSIKATDVLKGVATGTAAGVLAGWGALGVAVNFGTASTGAAIAGLSGAAATNATLAWLGGGAVAAGGGGIAMGSMVLGGIVALPALLVASGIMDARGQTYLNNARGNLSQARRLDSDADTVKKQVEVIIECISQNTTVINELRKNAHAANRALEGIVKKNNEWNDYSVQEKETVFASFKTTQLLKGVLDTPLLNENGSLTDEAKNIKNQLSK